MRSRLTTAVLVVALLSSAHHLLAQTRTGTITGTVTDESGAILPGVTVTLTSEALIAGTSVTTTDPAGAYRFVALLPGSYDVKFELAGFTSTTRAAIRVESAFVATVNVVMGVGGVQEAVVVSGASPIVDITSNVVSTRIDRDHLDHIPSGRDIWVVAEQVPGVVQDRYNIGGTESAQQSSGAIHGASGQQEFQFDGLTNNWPGGTGGAVMVYFDYDSFEEVQVVTNGAPAEVGTAGLYMNMVTKSGGNELHGSATLLYEPGEWQSNNVSSELRELGLEKANPVEHIYNIAPTLGGPIVRNRAWFFGSFLRYDINTVPDAPQPGLRQYSPGASRHVQISERLDSRSESRENVQDQQLDGRRNDRPVQRAQCGHGDRAGHDARTDLRQAIEAAVTAHRRYRRADQVLSARFQGTRR
jgi:hypothetical protein